MKKYKQLTREECYQLYSLLKMGISVADISKVFKRHKSTIYREIQRNKGKKGYHPKQAHTKAVERRHLYKTQIPDKTWKIIERLIRKDYSPDQISNRLRKFNIDSISYVWIYWYIQMDKCAGGSLYTHLRIQKQRKKKYAQFSKRGVIPGQISIEKRPRVVDKRLRYGDWEVDTIIGKNHKGAMVTLTERKSKLTLIKYVPFKTKELVALAIIELLTPLKIWVHTITSDNGREFTSHAMISKKLKCKFYFAHPYSSWERGLNENTNRLIRQYFPKGYDFRTIHHKQVEKTMNRLNNRPRKTLDYKTPNEVFFRRKMSHL